MDRRCVVIRYNNGALCATLTSVFVGEGVLVATTQTSRKVRLGVYPSRGVSQHYRANRL